MSACQGAATISKILVVDDDSNAVKLLKLNLEAYGFDVVMAINGRDGLDKASSESPDAIILDVRMPDLNGWQVCERLKKDPKTKAIPVIFLTAYSQKNEFEKSKTLGAELFLTKPLDPVELTQKIRGILDRNNTDREKGEGQQV
jgi:DNA-binding response OmpR family regulator